mmetsp:Transcript_16957/g.37024  ORF Transcript_16957/g.37024 Transcript_16957/m.37024 type:complete len:291 (+) Transcript_16957:174-1046(+)
MSADGMNRGVGLDVVAEGNVVVANGDGTEFVAEVLGFAGLPKGDVLDGGKFAGTLEVGIGAKTVSGGVGGRSSRMVEGKRRRNDGVRVAFSVAEDAVEFDVAGTVAFVGGMIGERARVVMLGDGFAIVVRSRCGRGGFEEVGFVNDGGAKIGVIEGKNGNETGGSVGRDVKVTKADRGGVGAVSGGHETNGTWMRGGKGDVVVKQVTLVCDRSPSASVDLGTGGIGIVVDFDLVDGRGSRSGIIRKDIGGMIKTKEVDVEGTTGVIEGLKVGGVEGRAVPPLMRGGGRGR